jgi:hypothetical protein
MLDDERGRLGQVEPWRALWLVLMDGATANL